MLANSAKTPSISKNAFPAAGIDRLIGGLERRALGSDSSNNILKISNAPGGPVDACDLEHFALAQEVKDNGKLCASHR